MYDLAHLFRKPEVTGYNHSRLVKDAASAFAPALGGAGLGALAAHTLGGSPWLGALLGGGAGYLGADYINDAFGLGPQPSAPPPGAGAPPINPRIPQTVGPGETMTAPPRDPLAISRSPDSMLPPAPPKAPASPNAAPPGSLRPPASSSLRPPPPPGALSVTGGGLPPGGAMLGGSVPPSASLTATPPIASGAPGSLRPPASGSLRPPPPPGALSVTGGVPQSGSATLGGAIPGQAAPQTPVLDGLYSGAEPGRPDPLGLGRELMQKLELAQDLGLMTPQQVQEKILEMRPDMRGITPRERLGLHQAAEERKLREKYDARRRALAPVAGRQ